MTRFKVRHVANVTIVTEMEADNLAHAKQKAYDMQCDDILKNQKEISIYSIDDYLPEDFEIIN